MVMPKIPALLLMVLLCSLLLCGCGGQPLSKREIVRAVFFAQQGEHYSVCLLLADQNAPEGESAFKTASAAAPSIRASARRIESIFFILASFLCLLLTPSVSLV